MNWFNTTYAREYILANGPVGRGITISLKSGETIRIAPHDQERIEIDGYHQEWYSAKQPDLREFINNFYNESKK